MSFIDFINHAGSWIRTINGVVRITEAVCDLDEAINDKSPESNTAAHRFKIAADIAVIATQAISIVGNHSKWSENSRFGISLAAGASDIS